MNARMYKESNSQQKISPYGSGNNFHNKSIEKANTISNMNNNLQHRGNYHYNYSPASSNHKIVQKTNTTAMTQVKSRQQFYQQKQLSYKQYAVSSSKSSLQNSTNNFKFTQSLFPNTFRLMDLNKFIKQNLALRKRLLNELSQIKQKKVQNFQRNNNLKANKQQIQSRSITPTRKMQHSREKSLNWEQRNNQLNQKDKQKQLQQLMFIKQKKEHEIQEQKHQLAQLQKKNNLKRQQIQKFQSQMLNQSIHETPLLREKQQLIEYLSVEVQWLNDKTAQLKKLTNPKFLENNIFEMYQQMCRQCEVLRKQNNKKSEKLKTLFDKTNKLTGKQENVNMFLMNLKV